MKLILGSLLAATLTTPLEGALPAQRQHLRTRPTDERLTVWVHAFTRSGSSTMMSMFSEAWGDQTTDDSMFALFEPCKAGDDVSEKMAAEGCGGLMRSLGQCDFSEINGLKNWFDLHSRRAGVRDFDRMQAAEACQTAPIRVFKTAVNPAKEHFYMHERLTVLDQVDGMIMMDVVRDPRNIYASMMSTWPFNVTANRDPEILIRMCDSFARGLNFTHDRMHRIIFENFLRHPYEVMKKAYAFIGADFGKKQQAWIAKHVDASDCPDQVAHPNIKAYSDCRTDSKSGIIAFETVMTDSEKAIFAEHGSCQRLKKAWDLP